MKEKEIRAAQLDALKDGITPGAFCIDLLNACFETWKTLKFETREEAEKMYDYLTITEPPAYVRKYAKFDY